MGPNNIQPFAPEFRKFTAPAILHNRCLHVAACQRTFLLTTPEREGICSNPFTCILSSCPRTLFNKKFRGATCCTQQNHTGERPYECKQRGNKNFSVTFLSRHTSERLYKCRHRGTLCTRNIQSFLIANFEHKNKSKYFFYIYRDHIGHTGACRGTSLVKRWHDDISKNAI